MGQSQRFSDFSIYFDAYRRNIEACPTLKSQAMVNDSVLSSSLPENWTPTASANTQSANSSSGGLEDEDTGDEIEIIYDRVIKKASHTNSAGEDSSTNDNGVPPPGEVKRLVRFLQQQLSDTYENDDDGEDGNDGLTTPPYTGEDDTASVDSDVVCLKSTKSSALRLTVEIQGLRQELQVGEDLDQVLDKAPQGTD